MKVRQKISNALGRRGLAALDQPRELLPQIAFLIKTHAQFRGLLMKVELDKRRECYESLKPFLSFPVKPLEDYEIEAKRLAEERKLPTIDEKGELHEFRVGEVGERVQQKAVEAIRVGMSWDKVGKSLVVTCGKCTAQAEFFGETLVEATQWARKAGWIYDKNDDKEQEICPKCPAIRERVN